MPKLRFPKYYPEMSNEHVLVSEFVRGKTLEECINDESLPWNFLIELFRIHGAYMFGIGTFHGDLHPGNCIIDEDGCFVFIDNGAICEAPGMLVCHYSISSRSCQRTITMLRSKLCWE